MYPSVHATMYTSESGASGRLARMPSTISVMPGDSAEFQSWVYVECVYSSSRAGPRSVASNWKLYVGEFPDQCARRPGRRRRP